MDSDKLDALKAEFAKEREICSGANASDAHKKRYADLAKELSVKITKADEPTAKKATVADTTDNVMRNSGTTTVSTNESSN